MPVFQKKIVFNTISVIFIAMAIIFFSCDIAIATNDNQIESKKIDTPNTLISLELEPPEIGGPLAPLNKLLSALNDGSKQSENKFGHLLKGVPNLLPDLYKVFISL
jgi:hypothetical protein